MSRDRRPGRVKQQQILRLLARDGDRCHWCQVRFSSAHQVTLEHLIPKHYGGTNSDDNTVLAGESCNHTRHHLVVCTACGNRIRRFGTAVWIDRRDVFHAHCAPVVAA